MRLIASTLMAGVMALGAVAPALADPPRYNNYRDYDRGRDRDRDWDRDDRRDWRDDRRDDRRHYRDGYRDGRKHWRRGDRFDRRVNYNYVVVRDYDRYRDHRGYRLRDPGRGHYYVRDDRTGDILLIAAATGLILWALND
jgi:Ni/Co efflux regulator RcnB